MADSTFFVTISQRTHFFVFWGRGRLRSSSTFTAFSERVSLIIPLLFSLLALVFVLAVGYWLLAVGRWLLAVGYWLLAVGYWLLARCIVMLKFAAKREQSQACLSYAEREQIEQS